VPRKRRPKNLCSITQDELEKKSQASRGLSRESLLDLKKGFLGLQNLTQTVGEEVHTGPYSEPNNLRVKMTQQSKTGTKKKEGGG